MDAAGALGNLPSGGSGRGIAALLEIWPVVPAVSSTSAAGAPPGLFSVTFSFAGLSGDGAGTFEYSEK